MFISFAIIFSHSVHFFFVIVSFAVPKLLSLITCLLFIFAFVSFALGRKKSLPQNCYNLCQSILPMFSSSFIISGLTFRSLIHFYFFYGMRNVLISFFYWPFTLKYIYISLAVLGLTCSMQVFSCPMWGL